jgi:hypothetical protein
VTHAQSQGLCAQIKQYDLNFARKDNGATGVASHQACRMDSSIAASASNSVSAPPEATTCSPTGRFAGIGNDRAVIPSALIQRVLRLARDGQQQIQPKKGLKIRPYRVDTYMAYTDSKPGTIKMSKNLILQVQ